MANRTCEIDRCERPHLARGWCKPHYRRWQTYGDPTATPTPEEWQRDVPDGQRRCRKCLTVKPLTDFYADARYSGGIHTWCKRCIIDYRLAFDKRPQRAAKLRVTRRIRTITDYGITVEQYDAMLAVQGGCAGCGGDPAGQQRSPHIDHDHASGRVRGILCHRCNTAIGLAGEDPARLRALAEYLER